MPKRALSVMGNEELCHGLLSDTTSQQIGSEKDTDLDKQKKDGKKRLNKLMPLKVDKKPDANLIIEAGEDEEAMTPYIPQK